MDVATAARAFEPFFTTKGVGEGTGLGLSQVYGFATQSGGAVHILTSPGQGTTVELILPKCAEGAAPEQTAAEPSGLHAGRAGQVILVVYDDLAVLEVTSDSLQELGYTTVTAEGAQAAIDCLRGPDRVDLLFSDVVMPGGMNGLQLSIEARRLRPTLKVLLTSGYATAAFGGKLPDNVSFITKPYGQELLAQHLRNLLGPPLPAKIG